VNRLPINAQKALQQLACIGNSPEPALLTMLFQHSTEDVHGDLWEAVRAGLVFRSDRSYRFLHDRVQEAAYSLIPAGQRAAHHLRIGRLMAAHTPPGKREEAVFEIVTQLNRGATLITSREERDQLAELNLMAGQRAKGSIAYASALSYLIAGAALLATDSWEQRHELTFTLELQRAECEFLTGALAASEQRLVALSRRAATTSERASITCLLADLYTTVGQGRRAVAIGLDYLRALGVDWSSHPTLNEARREYRRIWSLLGDRTLDELVALPLMGDATSLAALDVLTKVQTAAFYTDVNLTTLVTCLAVDLSLQFGNSDGSCPHYAVLGRIAGPHFGDYEAGHRLARIAYELVEQRGLTRFKAKTYLIYQSVLSWTRFVGCRVGERALSPCVQGLNRRSAGIIG
jgi:predicted ATPase